VISPQLRIEPVDPTDQAGFAQYYDVFADCNRHDRSDTFTPPGADAARSEVVGATRNIRYDLFVLLPARG
jgi:hypothetical protein